jgi:hypothetical protein
MPPVINLPLVAKVAQLRMPAVNLYSLMRAGCYLSAVAIFLLNLIAPQAVAVSVIFIVPVLLSAWHREDWFIKGIATVCSLLMVFTLLIRPPTEEELVFVAWNDGIALAAIWTTALVMMERKKIAALREEALRERDAAKEESEALSSLLPVCAWCKKIRDDTGYWGQVEDYIAKHTNAAPTHGMCPDCSTKMMAEAAKYSADLS